MAPLSPIEYQIVREGVATERSLQERLKNIQWLANCGKPIDYAGTLPIYRATSWAEAGKLIHDPTWSNVLLSEQNNMSLYLGKNYFQRFQIEWSEEIVEAASFYEEHLKVAVSQAVSQAVQDASIANDIMTTIRSLCLKGTIRQYFADCMSFPFYDDALQILEAGHLPCGWILPWPNGKLAVY